MSDEPGEPERRRRMLPTGFATLRDAFTFILGVGIILWEVVGAVKVDAAVLAVGLAMAGLPVVFGADERRKGEQ